eukprot:CAMPEP_0172910010 /NCGR_PEP_ID=MMETSP1075-20121228/183811_1 /TAXON_ID=2916 /ORGANISM="Ceratium fusus, Strain PA161109" /LENGTH=254 /DNA_ID=CAMNT_0013768077 /DNA_START=179 /DNA_END=944 /DNA_ORIENTATION=+
MESPSRSENDFNIDGSVRDFLVEPLHRITTTQALNDVDGLTCWIKTVVYQFYTWQRVPGGQGARAHAKLAVGDTSQVAISVWSCFGEGAETVVSSVSLCLASVTGRAVEGVCSATRLCMANGIGPSGHDLKSLSTSPSFASSCSDLALSVPRDFLSCASLCSKSLITSAAPPPLRRGVSPSSAFRGGSHQGRTAGSQKLPPMGSRAVRVTGVAQDVKDHMSSRPPMMLLVRIQGRLHRMGGSLTSIEMSLASKL